MTNSSKTPLNVALVGHGFMGAAHSQGWRVAPRFFDLAYEPRMEVVVGQNPDRVEVAREKFGWQRGSTDWRSVIDDPAIDVVDICTPGGSHADIAIAALDAGKHVICEKPLANTLAQAEVMTEAAERASTRGVRSLVGFSYRRLPAAVLARQFIEQGRLGEIRQIRAEYRQDWLTDENAPITWRLDRALAGSGPLSDLGAHLVDMVHFLTQSTINAVSATSTTFVRERPLLADRRGLGGTASNERGEVTVEDAVWFTAKLGTTAVASFEATRFATGRKNAFRIEVSGSRGALYFDVENLNELHFYDGTVAPAEQGFTRILVTEPGHPFVSAWWPAGHVLGWEHAFSHQIADFVSAISSGENPSPSFADGLRVQRVLAATQSSAQNNSAWVRLDSSAPA